MSPKIAVLGAGIIGISTAIAIQQKIPDAQVTVIAEKFSPETTSDVAAGLIEPYLCDDQVDRIIKWTRSTISRIEEYMETGNPGAEEMSGYWLQSVQEVPKWLEVMKNVNVLTEPEMKRVRRRPEHKFGIFYSTYYLEPTAYIRWSSDIFVKNGGKFEKCHVAHLDDVIARGYDVIVNCCGLGAGKLVRDEQLVPVRGQIMRVSCPAVKHFFIDDNYYALLNENCIILGGTKDVNQWDTTIDPMTSSRILEQNRINIPALKNARVISEHVGLRPSRTTVRLDSESIDNCLIVHNYGHGGSGITLHWGCALECSEIVWNKLFVKSKL